MAINISISDRTIQNLKISPSSAIFSPSNWGEPQKIIITLEDDEIATRSTMLEHEVVTQDEYYQSILGRLIILNIQDADPGILLNKADNTPLLQRSTTLSSLHLN